MPIITTTPHDNVTTQHITGDPTRASASVTLVAPESGYTARLQFIIEGTQSDKPNDIKEKLGIKGDMQPNSARPSLSQYEVPREERAQVLKSLGLSPELGGRNGVTVTFAVDTGGYRSSSINIVANDPKAPAFTVEHADQMTTTLAQKKGVLPENVRAAIVKENPGMVARVMMEPDVRGGTRLEFKPVEDGNLKFKIRHNAATGADELVLPASNNPQHMQALHARVTEHLKAHNITPTGSNLGHIEDVIAHHTKPSKSPGSMPDTPPTVGEVKMRTGGLQISLPHGSGEKALEALSKPATVKIAGITEFLKPLLPPEIAKAAVPEMAETVRPIAVAEQKEKLHLASAGKTFSFGNLLTKLGVGAAVAGVAGAAAAAQAPEGERLETGMKVARKTAAEQMLPGITETDMCKKVGANGAAFGASVAGGTAFVAITTGTVVTAVPSGGGSVVLAATTGAVAVGAATIAGGGVGQLLGEGGCNLVRAAYNAIAPENRAQMAHKPEAATAPQAKAPDASPKVVQAHGTAASRG